MSNQFAKDYERLRNTGVSIVAVIFIAVWYVALFCIALLVLAGLLTLAGLNWQLSALIVGAFFTSAAVGWLMEKFGL